MRKWRILLGSIVLLVLACFVGAEGVPGYFMALQSERQVSNPLVRWQHFGPGMSGYIDKFWIHDTDPNAMFMHLDMGNAHGTWNRGQSWETIRDSDGTDSTLDGITAVEFSHQDPDFGLLLAKEGVYATTNRSLPREHPLVRPLGHRFLEGRSVGTKAPTDSATWIT